MPVQFGLAIKNFVGPTETPDIDELYRYAQRAEALGFESLWAWDHVILGVEPAFPILDAVGVPFKRRGRLFERNFDILTRLWTDDRVSRSEEHTS